MTKHTQGPWKYDGEFIRANTGPHEQTTIAIVRGWMSKYASEEAANGRLIAAAPELLEALKGLTDKYKGDASLFAFSEQLLAARAAIAKAEGK